jgi:hypothetical protein
MQIDRSAAIASAFAIGGLVSALAPPRCGSGGRHTPGLQRQFGAKNRASISWKKKQNIWIRNRETVGLIGKLP